MLTVTAADLRELFQKAEESPRRRAVLTVSSEEEPVQFLYNALLPGTYVQPHKHEEKDEYFQIVIGEVLVVIFGDDGQIQSVEMLSQQLSNSGISCRINPGEWHSVIALQPSVILEVKQGPYDPATAKVFAFWAPSEDDSMSDSYRAALTEAAVRAFAEQP